MIKSTKVSIKFANKNKKDTLVQIIDEYRRVVSFFIDSLWSLEKVPVLVPKDITDKCDTWLSARMKQCASKQASGIVRGTQAKQRKRLYAIQKMIEDNRLEEAKKLQKIYDNTIITKPVVDDLEMELSSQIVSKVDMQNDTQFDGWITLTSIGNKIKLALPFKKTKHLNRLLNRGGTLTSGVRLSKCGATFMVNTPDVSPVSDGVTIGIDIGQNSCISVSNGQVVECDPHGHTYMSICKELARKKKGSKAFNRKQKHRANFIHYCVNRINFDGVKNMRIERIRQLRTGVRTSRLLSGWSYKKVFDALRGKVETLGVQVTELSPTYTSQRCSKCGRVRKANRKGKVYTCDHCGLTMDADVNAAINISLLLPEIPKEVRLKGLNKTGFFWNLSGISLDCHEPIVRDALKTNFETDCNVC